MKLFLLRHAKAEAGFPDGERALAAKGRAQARILAAFLKRSGRFHPRAFWCSPLLRARQTLEAVVDLAGLSAPVREEMLLEPEADPAPLLRQLDEGASEDLLLVGHNPNLETLASLLIGGERSRVRVHMKTCSLLCLEYHPVPNFGQTGPCELRWMLDPRWLGTEGDGAG